MTIKHNFSDLFGQEQIINGIFVMMNKGDHIFYYGILLLIFITFAVVFIRKTEDVGKSLLMSLFVVFVLAIILFYYGMLLGVVFIPDVLMYAITVILLVGTAGIHYSRKEF